MISTDIQREAHAPTGIAQNCCAPVSSAGAEAFGPEPCGLGSSKLPCMMPHCVAPDNSCMPCDRVLRSATLCGSCTEGHLEDNSLTGAHLQEPMQGVTCVKEPSKCSTSSAATRICAPVSPKMMMSPTLPRSMPVPQMEPRKSLQAKIPELFAKVYNMQCPSCEGDDQKTCHKHSMDLEYCLLRDSTHLCVTASNMKLPFTLSAAIHPSCVQ